MSTKKPIGDDPFPNLQRRGFYAQEEAVQLAKAVTPRKDVVKAEAKRRGSGKHK